MSKVKGDKFYGHKVRRRPNPGNTIESHRYTTIVLLSALWLEHLVFLSPCRAGIPFPSDAALHAVYLKAIFSTNQLLSPLRSVFVKQVSFDNLSCVFWYRRWRAAHTDQPGKPVKTSSYQMLLTCCPYVCDQKSIAAKVHYRTVQR